MARWQLQDAKAKLSELVRSAQDEGPQEITVRGEPAAVVLSAADYQRLRARRPGFVDFVRRSPLAGEELEIVRDRGPARRVRLCPTCSTPWSTPGATEAGSRSAPRPVKEPGPRLGAA
jgi:prevent-host-death family protein